jgi:hypothetical protein
VFVEVPPVEAAGKEEGMRSQERSRHDPGVDRADEGPRGKDTLEQLGMVYKFVMAMLAIKQRNGQPIAAKVFWHQLCQIHIAAERVLISAIAYQALIERGLEEGRWDAALSIAAAMMTLRFLAYRLNLNFFHGSYLILHYLRGRLLNRYATLTAQDFDDKEASSERHYRVAIVYTAEEVREGCWKSIFHRGLPALYRVVWSLVYLAFCTGASAVLSFRLTLSIILLLCFEVCWRVWRLQAGRRIWLDGLKLQQEAEQKLASLLHDGHMQMGYDDRQAAREVREAYRKFIENGPYRTWYHRFYTRSAAGSPTAARSPY